MKFVVCFTGHGNLSFPKMPFLNKRQAAARRREGNYRLEKLKLSIPFPPQSQDPTLPESASFHLTEPLMEPMKQESVSDVPPSQPLDQVLFVVKEEASISEPSPDETLVCFLCLRSCTFGEVVDFSTESGWNCQHKLGLILGLPLELERGAICRACWIMVETLVDFREGCLKAAAVRERFPSIGLDEESVADGWLCKENVEALERTRTMVQEHVGRIDAAEVDAINRLNSSVDRIPKMEPLEEDGQDLVEVMQVVEPSEDSFSNPNSPEDLTENESTDDAPEIVDKVDFKAFSCKNCQRKFETKHGMMIHFKYCIRPAREKLLTSQLFTCSICSANFTERRSLESHNNMHLGIKPLQCRKENCNKRFYHHSARTNHERKCNGIDHEEESSEDSSQNLSFGETQRETTIYPCSKCPRKYTTKRAIQRHMQQCRDLEESPKLYTCTICSMEFPSHHNFDAHMNKHNGIKPYKCNRENCGQHFYGKRLLYHHNQTCGREKPVCPLCGVQLASKVSLRSHMETHADAATECETCGKKFKSKKAVRRHQLVHSGERNFPCSECGKALKSTSALRIHMRIHTLEKPYSCSVCGKAFAYKSLVKPHMEKYHSGQD